MTLEQITLNEHSRNVTALKADVWCPLSGTLVQPNTPWPHCHWTAWCFKASFAPIPCQLRAFTALIKSFAFVFPYWLPGQLIPMCRGFFIPVPAQHWRSTHVLSCTEEMTLIRFLPTIDGFRMPVISYDYALVCALQLIDWIYYIAKSAALKPAVCKMSSLEWQHTPLYNLCHAYWTQDGSHGCFGKIISK